MVLSCPYFCLFLKHTLFIFMFLFCTSLHVCTLHSAPFCYTSIEARLIFRTSTRNFFDVGHTELYKNGLGKPLLVPKKPASNWIEPMDECIILELAGRLKSDNSRLIGGQFSHFLFYPITCLEKSLHKNEIILSTFRVILLFSNRTIGQEIKAL